MNPLTAKHAQLLKSNRALLLAFEGLPQIAKLSAVGLALALGIYGGIKALGGTASDRVQVCIRNKQVLQCADKTGKPYLMTQYHAEQWKANGIPGEVAFLKPTPATNPHKTLWMLLSACSFGAAGVGLRSLQNSERQLAGYEAIAEKRDLTKGEITARGELLEDYRGVAIAEVHLQADLEAAANDRAVILKQCEVLGEAGIKIAAMDAEEAIFEAETAGLSDDKKQEYMEFLRNQKTPFLLSGTQTLDSVTNPGDKVNDRTPGAIEPETKPTDATPLAQPSSGEGMAIIDGLVGSRRSLLLVGATGAGKSITQACMLTKFLQLVPAAEVWVIAQKNDSFCGLDKKGRVVLFDSLSPKSALKTIDRIHAVYDQRRRLPERARADLPPVRLILADWLSINQALEESSKDEPVKSSKYLTKLTDIIYNGRELNVCLWVDLQSFNLAAIGLKADANSRKNFNLVGLGNYSVDEFGCINESYGVLANMVGNKYMVADEDERAALLANFKRLKPVSQQHQRPIIFTTLEPARVALLPDLRHYKQASKQPEPNPPEPDDRAYLKRTYKLEFDLNTPPDSPADNPNLSDSQPRKEPDRADCQDSDGHPEPLSGAVSGVSWNVRKVKEMYPNLTPEQLFESVSASAKAGTGAREIIRSILKCGERSDHPTRSYTGHGKTLLRWLIENYDNGEVASLPEIKKFLEGGNNGN